MIKPYKNAPIIEAVLEFIVDPVPEIKADQLEKIQSALSEQYPLKSNIQAASVSIQLSNESSVVNTQQAKQGIRLESADKKRVLQIYHNRFAYSLMAPYTEWSLFRDEAKKLWNIYKKYVKPKMIVRVGLRNINRIDAEDGTKLEKYFKLYPNVPDDVKEPIANFLLKLQIPSAAGMAVIHQAAAPHKDGKISIILDIDLSNEKKISVSRNDAWTLLEKMRTRKDQLFETFITPDTRKRFN